MTKPYQDWSGYTIVDVHGKVAVQIRNGYLSTGFSRMNEALPNFLRCFETSGKDGKPSRRWTAGVSEIHVPELDGKFPNAVVQHYWKIFLNSGASAQNRQSGHDAVSVR